MEEGVNALEMGGGFKPFQRVFYRWAMALGYHVLAQRLLIDREAQEAGWLLVWRTPHVTTTGRQWLATLVEGDSRRQYENNASEVLRPLSLPQ